MVDGLESELEGQVQVIRLSVTSDVGRSAAVRYQIRAMPTFLVLDGTGRVRYVKGGIVAKADLLRGIEPLLGEDEKEG